MLFFILSFSDKTVYFTHLVMAYTTDFMLHPAAPRTAWSTKEMQLNCEPYTVSDTTLFLKTNLVTYLLEKTTAAHIRNLAKHDRLDLWEPHKQALHCIKALFFFSQPLILLTAGIHRSILEGWQALFKQI